MKCISTWGLAKWKAKNVNKPKWYYLDCNEQLVSKSFFKTSFFIVIETSHISKMY